MGASALCAPYAFTIRVNSITPNVHMLCVRSSELARTVFSFVLAPACNKRDKFLSPLSIAKKNSLEASSAVCWREDPSSSLSSRPNQANDLHIFFSVPGPPLGPPAIYLGREVNRSHEKASSLYHNRLPKRDKRERERERGFSSEKYNNTKNWSRSVITPCRSVVPPFASCVRS